MTRRILAESRKNSRRGALLAAAALGGAPAGALAQSPVLIDVSRCVELPSAEDRFACYEAQTRAAREKDAAKTSSSSTARQPAPEAQAAGPPSPPNDEAPAAPSSSRGTPPTARPAPPAPSARASTGEPAAPASEPQDRSRKTERRSGLRTADGPADRVATVAALRERLPNQWVITLDNGEVWLQTRPGIYRLRVGDEIHLHATHWGDSQQLSAAQLRGFILVKRVQ